MVGDSELNQLLTESEMMACNLMEYGACKVITPCLDTAMVKASTTPAISLIEHYLGNEFYFAICS